MISVLLFQIERSLDESVWATIDTVGADVTAYADTGLAPATTYHYRVQAYNGAGASGYSDPASATTLEGPAITLTGVGFKLKAHQTVDLTWTGATTANVDIYRNGMLMVTTPDEGFYRDSLGKGVTGTFTYMVCEEGSTECSNTVTITF